MILTIRLEAQLFSRHKPTNRDGRLLRRLEDHCSESMVLYEHLLWAFLSASCTLLCLNARILSLLAMVLYTKLNQPLTTQFMDPGYHADYLRRCYFSTSRSRPLVNKDLIGRLLDWFFIFAKYLFYPTGTSYGGGMSAKLLCQISIGAKEGYFSVMMYCKVRYTSPRLQWIKPPI